MHGDGCSRDCTKLERCGNGQVDEGEVCDGSNTRSGDGCREDCVSDETCGNGEIDRAVGEVCDDGNTRSGHGCNATWMVSRRGSASERRRATMSGCPPRRDRRP